VKSNDQIPADEMLLAEAIAAARANNLSWCEGRPFVYYNNVPVACCVNGALQLAGREAPAAAWIGNDSGNEPLWGASERDDGISLGNAFRCAMEDV
jgi:hypothetical protein